MASPVNIRAFAPIPFPALVVGGAPVAVTKANGIWTIALNVANLTQHIPAGADFASEYLVVYDAVRQTFFKVLLSTAGLAGARVQRAVNASPIVVLAGDQVINFNINAGGPTCALPAAASRNGVPLTFKDAGGHAAANNLTITPAAGETIDGLANVAMNTNFQQLTLAPYNDGTNAGWALS
jgi:hypothetical protein